MKAEISAVRKDVQSTISQYEELQKLIHSCQSQLSQQAEQLSTVTSTVADSKAQIKHVDEELKSLALAEKTALESTKTDAATTSIVPEVTFTAEEKIDLLRQKDLVAVNQSEIEKIKVSLLTDCF